MTDGVLKRTQYRNLSTGTVRTGATGHGESLTDVEEYLLPIDQARGAALFSAGVADGLEVRATTGSTGVTVRPGTALDPTGRLLVLAPGGTAVVDPNVDPAQIQDVPTVIVPTDGVVLATAGPAGDLVLTLTWLEVQGQSVLANAPALLHAPWLRLLPPAELPDGSEQVVLAVLTVDDGGAVTSLTPGDRRLVGLPTGVVRFRVPGGGAAGGGPVGGGVAQEVGQAAVAELEAEPGGGLRLNLLTAGSPPTPLRIDAAGNVGIGIGGAQAQRSVHVEGNGVHSGGAGGGFSFAGRDTSGFVSNPSAGERWVWYASGGAARLWSGFDRLSIGASGEGGGLDVSRRMRVRQGGDSSAGIWFHQDTPGNDRAFVGMMDDTHVGFWGNTGAGWGLSMDTGSGALAVTAAGTAITAQGSATGFGIGVRAHAGIGIYTEGTGIGLFSSSANIAGLFGGLVRVSGDLEVSGSISKGGGGFRIDHPLAPEAKFLSHSFVESPDMLTVYTGTTVTGDDGRAEVELPDYFDALNSDPRVQLTAVGALALVALDGEVAGNRFPIRTDTPGVTVAWQVTGVRRDAWAAAHRIPVEVDKTGPERSRYLHPLEHGQPESTSLSDPDPGSEFLRPVTPTDGD